MPTASTHSFEFFVTKNYGKTLSWVTGVFLALFLSIFLPFGVSNYDPHFSFNVEFAIIMSLISSVTALTILLLEFTLKPRILGSPSLLSVVAWSLLELVAVGLIDFLLYNYLGNWHDWHFRSAVRFILEVSSVLIFPFAGVFFYYRYKSLRLDLQLAREITHPAVRPKTLIAFEGRTSVDHLSIPLADVLFGKAQDNYVELHYLQSDAVRSKLLRGTMTEVLEGAQSDFLVRCHRSYFVNLYNISTVEGGSRVQLHVEGVDEAIPVSKTYQAEVLDRLRELHARP